MEFLLKASANTYDPDEAVYWAQRFQVNSEELTSWTRIELETAIADGVLVLDTTNDVTRYRQQHRPMHQQPRLRMRLRMGLPTHLPMRQRLHRPHITVMQALIGAGATP